MFSIQTLGYLGKRHRVLADTRLDEEDFQGILRKLRVTPITARKTGFVAARCATHGEAVETRWNGVETNNSASPGDWIVTNLSSGQTALRDGGGHTNTYVVRSDRFCQLYEPAGCSNEFGSIYRPKQRVQALYLSGGFQILAPWGEMQHASKGYLVLNGNEVYGNNKETFEATYSPE